MWLYIFSSQVIDVSSELIEYQYEEEIWVSEGEHYMFVVRCVQSFYLMLFQYVRLVYICSTTLASIMLSGYLSCSAAIRIEHGWSWGGY